MLNENGKCRLLMGVYYMVICIIFSYAAYYLRAEGFSSWQTGLIVSASCIAGALLQPVSGRLADSDPKWFWKNQLLLFTALALAISVLRIFVSGLLWEGACYGLLIVLVLVMMPLVNSACFYYADRGISVDFGTARGIGSFSYAAASFVLGRLTAVTGPQALTLCCAVLFALVLAAVAIMPQSGCLPDVPQKKEEQRTKDFVSAYPAVILMAAGITLALMFHNIVATYMINIMEEVGGGPDSMGTAIAIGGAMELPALFLYTRIKKKSGLSAAALISVGCLFFVIRGVLFVFASGVMMIYFIQLLQGPSYGLVTAAKAAYAYETVSARDETTGQAVMSMTDSLGIVGGSLLGGILLSGGGADLMLMTGTALAAAGTTVAFIAAKAGRRGDDKNGK